MKKVTDLQENECIHCETKEQFEKILALNPSNNVEVENWADYKNETIYYPFDYNGEGMFGDVEYSKKHNHTIYPATDFLNVYPKMMYVSDDNKNCNDEIKRLVVDEFRGQFIVEFRNSYSIWKYAKDIETETITMEQVAKALGKELGTFKIETNEKN